MKSILRHRPIWRQIFSLAPYSGSILHHYKPQRPFSHTPFNPNSNISRPLIFPEVPGSSNEHHDLASYAAYASRTGLDLESKTYVGTRYEYAVAESLSRLGFSLKRVGGRADAGIDLLGTWRVPLSSSSSSGADAPLRVLVQCKVSTSKSTKIGPHHVRELEGAFVGAPPGWRSSGPGSGVLGFLVAQRPATKGMRDALSRSRWPMGYMSCAQDGRLEQMIWNGRAEEEGLEGLGVGVRFSEDANGGRTEQHLVLTWKGKPYEFDKEVAEKPV